MDGDDQPGPQVPGLRVSDLRLRPAQRLFERPKRSPGVSLVGSCDPLRFCRSVADEMSLVCPTDVVHGCWPASHAAGLRPDRPAGWDAVVVLDLVDELLWIRPHSSVVRCVALTDRRGGDRSSAGAPRCQRPDPDIRVVVSRSRRSRRSRHASSSEGKTRSPVRLPRSE